MSPKPSFRWGCSGGQNTETGPCDDFPILAERKGYRRLDIQSGGGAVAWPHIQTARQLEREGNLICERIVFLLSQFLRFLAIAPGAEAPTYYNCAGGGKR
jgi:hypothetical protein